MSSKIRKLRRLDKIIFSLFVIFLLHCCAKPSPISQKKLIPIYRGKVWLKITFKENKKSKHYKTISTYGSFKTCNDFLFINIKTPFNTSFLAMLWEKRIPYLLRIYDFSSQKIYYVYLPKTFKTSLSKEFLSKDKGTLEFYPLFSLKWKIKHKKRYTTDSLEKELPKLPEFKTIKIIRITSF